MNRASGFTLIELMIVVSIIAIIAGIALPSLLRTRAQANEASAIASLRAIVAAEVSYHAANSTYTGVFGDLISGTPPFLVGQWDVPKSGYHFTLAGGGHTYTCNADPESFAYSGTRGFFVDHTAIVRYAIGASAGPASKPVGE